MPAQFTNNSQIDCEAGEILRGADPHIHLNLFVLQVRNCPLPFDALGTIRRII